MINPIKKKYLVWLFLISCFASNAQQQTPYEEEMEKWHQSRLDFLLSPDGWFNLEGLFWLKPGINQFGSAKNNDLVYNNPLFPKRAGYFEWTNGQVNWVSDQGVNTLVNDSLFNKGIVYEEGGKLPILNLGSFRWNIIKREDKIGVRFRDLASKSLTNFKPIQHYPVDPKWRVQARLEKSNSQALMITNILGQTIAENTPGKLVFTIDGETFRLDALEEGDQLFIIFGDATSGKETYAAGRFVYTNKPDASGNTILDFNKCFNPPCAFSVYATCPLPPKQNFLPISITAGEKDYEGHATKK